MGHDACKINHVNACTCMCKNKIFWACAEDQSYGDAIGHVQRTGYQQVVVKMNPSTEDTCNNTGTKHRVQKATIAIAFKALIFNSSNYGGEL